jgi:DNA invertase Pin-like site-specific DNA recombinase/ribosomal protein S19
MMMTDVRSKITTDHLQKNAYLYIRQSTIKQVIENTESTKRQYALQQKGIALGWPITQIIVIDTDQGQSGAKAADREGFQRLVTEVSLGHAGIVMGLEVSRLARNSTDWHRLLEICALTKTLILDEEGVYDPGHFNDRLLLGLKGTMSEAELHVLKARLQGGAINKAKRGDLEIALPLGFVYNIHKKVIRDPNQQIQQTISMFFNLFRQTGSACATVAAFNRQKILFPRVIRCGLHKGDVVWVELTHSKALHILHNPRYAGAYVFGRRRVIPQVNGGVYHKKLDPDQWQVIIPNAHEGYITWEDYQNNLQRLRENTQAFHSERIKTPPREGSALLQGLVICGRCGQRMTVRYHIRRGQLIPDYVCQRYGIEHGQKHCQSIRGERIDKMVGMLLLDMINLSSMEVVLAIQQEVESRFSDLQKIYLQQIEAARYEAELAKRRYRQVDPENRLVASTLEFEWNEKLRLLDEAQKNYNEQQQQKELFLSAEQKEQIAALTKDFPIVWNSSNVAHRDRKRIVRLLIEDVTLHQDTQIIVHIRFKGGTTKTLTLSLPKNAPDLFATSADVIAKIDLMLNNFTDLQIANYLNEQGDKPGRGIRFSSNIIKNIRRAYSLKSLTQRLREKGYTTADEMASSLKLSTTTIHRWRKQGRLKGCIYNDRGEYLYKPLNESEISSLKQSKWTHETEH